MIFYFSGTGNTQWTARELARGLHEPLISIPVEWEAHATEGPAAAFAYTPARGETVGFAFPVYAWGPPPLVLAFIERLKIISENGTYVFFVCTCGDDMGRTRNILSRALLRRGIRLDAGFFLNMPDSYVALPGFDVDSDAERTEKLEKAPGTLKHILQTVQKRPRQYFEEKPGGFPWMKSYVIRPLFNRFLITDRPFRADERCTSCGLCARTCPVKNITMTDGKPHWKGHCTGCLSCYHHCPVQALQLGNRTRGKGQYLHDKYDKP